MTILFDHLVFYVKNLDEAVNRFQQKGYHVVYGGSHPMWGTYNALIYFQSLYIELIAVENEPLFTQAAQEPFTLHEAIRVQNFEEGIVTYAFRVNDNQLLKDSLQAHQFQVIGPDEFSRKTKDGTVISWTLLHVGSNENEGYPFLINWQRDDRERLESFRKSGVIKAHPNGVDKLQIVRIFTTDIERYRAYFSALNIPITETANELLVKLENVTLHYVKNDNKNARNKYELHFNSNNTPSYFTEANVVFTLN